MKNLIEQVSEQMARVGRVRPIHEYSNNDATPENLIMAMNNANLQPLKR
ncbi:hypothetical protein [Zobellia barbeyronii]|uniref:Uncharacterized protein n=1 Tax=Zobellia barbeyronii TaxID=2748009 RepID=A0ABS5W8G9_9FLAO|nr:hypothetical protein [Zobellia barbeyronii]MBT2159728.1 hypothetical protein [Zobellia barbeyronii]